MHETYLFVVLQNVLHAELRHWHAHLSALGAGGQVVGALYHGGRLEVGALGSADSLFHQLSEKVIEITSFGNKLTIMQDILKFQTDEVL